MHSLNSVNSTKHWCTRMHSSRMRTACSSSHLGGLHQAPPRSGTPRIRHPPRARHPPDQAPTGRSPSTSQLGEGLDQIPLNFPLGCGPGPDPPPLPPSVWAWRPPLETCCKACWDTTCNACWDSTPLETCCKHAGTPPAMHTGIAPPVDRHTPVNILPCPKLRLRAVINLESM